MKKDDDYIIPTLLSDYVEDLKDWEIVEYVSRHKATSKYLINGASEALYAEMQRVWNTRYPDEEVPVLECVPPLDCELNFLYECKREIEEKDE